MSKRLSPSLGRRLLPAVAMTAAASGLVAFLDRPSSGIAEDVGSDTVPLPDQGAVEVASEPPTVSSTLPAVVEQSSTTVPPVPGDLGEPDEYDDDEPDDEPATTTTAASAPVDTTPVVAAGPCEGQTIDGPPIPTVWGPVQVQAVVSATGQICDVNAIKSPYDRRKSVEINEDALPILHTRVLNAQSTTIKGVSGATVTKDAYVRSLQAILDGVVG